MEQEGPELSAPRKVQFLFALGAQVTKQQKSISDWHTANLFNCCIATNHQLKAIESPRKDVLCLTEGKMRPMGSK